MKILLIALSCASLYAQLPLQPGPPGPAGPGGGGSGTDAEADGATKGIAAFVAADFNCSSGICGMDYTNAQKATASVPGLLAAADFSTFDGKVGGKTNCTSVGLVPFVTSSGVVTCAANLEYVTAQNRLHLGPGTGISLGNDSGISAIHFGVSSRSTLNYALAGDNTTLLNGLDAVLIRANNASKIAVTTSGVCIGPGSASCSGTGRIKDTTATTGTTDWGIVAGAADTATSKLLRLFQNDGTTEKFAVTRDGSIILGGDAEVTCNSGARGKTTAVFGSTGVGDTLRTCLKDATDTYNWVTHI